MKYYIEYPIKIKCGLRCPYCFHNPLWEYIGRSSDKQLGDICAFTFDEYKTWRDTHLTDATEILMELQGGEPSFMDNAQLVLDIIDASDKERFQIQSNGFGDFTFYEELVSRKNKIDRIGFTYHRKVIEGTLPKNNIEPISNIPFRFINNVELIKHSGIKTYVKELLFLDCKDEILKHKKYWKDRNVEFRIQDFKGLAGLDGTETSQYTDEDWGLIYEEYKHTGSCCNCRSGYKQLILRGYDQWGGDVLACWQDHKVIGNILENWYEPYEEVLIDRNASRGRTVVGKGFYRSDFLSDMKQNQLEKQFFTINPQGVCMLLKFQELLNKLNQDRQGVAAEVDELQKMVLNFQKRIQELSQQDTFLLGEVEGLNKAIALAAEPKAEPVAEMEAVAESILKGELPKLNPEAINYVP